MKKSLYRILKTKATLGNIFFFTTAQTLVQMFLVYVMSSKLKRYSQENILDLRFFYSGNDIISYFNELGEEGRMIYMITEIVDLLYPLFYVPAMMLIIIYLASYSRISESWLYRSLFAPLMLACFDYLENLAIIFMLYSYPENNYFYTLTGFFSNMKYLMLGTSLAILTVIAIMSVKNELLHD